MCYFYDSCKNNRRYYCGECDGCSNFDPKRVPIANRSATSHTDECKAKFFDYLDGKITWAEYVNWILARNYAANVTDTVLEQKHINLYDRTNPISNVDTQ